MPIFSKACLLAVTTLLYSSSTFINGQYLRRDDKGVVADKFDDMMLNRQILSTDEVEYFNVTNQTILPLPDTPEPILVQEMEFDFDQHRHLQSNAVTLCDFGKNDYCNNFGIPVEKYRYLNFNALSYQNGYLQMNPSDEGASFYLLFRGCTDFRTYDSISVTMFAPYSPTSIKLDVGVSSTGCQQKSNTIYTGAYTIPQGVYFTLIYPMSMFAAMDLSKAFTMGFGAGVGKELRLIRVTLNKSNAVTCKCDTPNAGTANFNRFSCSDGSFSWCMANQACSTTQSWIKGSNTQFCSVPAPVSAPSPAAPPTPSGSAASWLNAHNNRRLKYHNKYGRSYVPLKWSSSLEQSARSYAQTLVNNGCKLVHSGSGPGENLYWSWSSSSSAPPSAEDVLTGWAEKEEPNLLQNKPFSDWGHFTQVIWRATKYVGCGVASGSCGSVAVCHYVAAGNCALSSNPLNEALGDNTCNGANACPREGCF